MQKGGRVAERSVPIGAFRKLSLALWMCCWQVKGAIFEEVTILEDGAFCSLSASRNTNAKALPCYADKLIGLVRESRGVANA